MKNKAIILRCNTLWQAIARLRPCAVCGITHNPYDISMHIHGHHEIGRGSLFYLHMLENQTPLCTRHHTGGIEGTRTILSPHGTPVDYEIWRSRERPEQQMWLNSMREAENWMRARNQVRRPPDLEELQQTEKHLTEFLAAGVPYVFSENG